MWLFLLPKALMSVLKATKKLMCHCGNYAPILFDRPLFVDIALEQKYLILIASANLIVVVLTYGVDFTNMFTPSFYTCRSQKNKNSNKLSISFCAFGICMCKTARKMLTKSTIQITRDTFLAFFWPHPLPHLSFGDTCKLFCNITWYF